GQLGGDGSESNLVPARGPRPRGLALVEAQLLAQEQQLQRSVVLALGDEVREVQDEREYDMENEEGHRQAPAVVCGTGSGSVAQDRGTSRFPWPEAETRILAPYGVAGRRYSTACPPSTAPTRAGRRSTSSTSAASS